MRKKVKFLIPIVILTGVIISLVGCNKKEENKEITVSIAASLKDPMEKIGENFTKETGVEVKYNIGGSGTLQKQILSGASVNMFFSANKEYSEDLVSKGYVYENKVYPILTNSLVVVGNESLKNLDDLKNATGKIAIGEINTVPAGMYAKESLEYYNLYNSVKDKLVYGKSVKSALEYVESGNAEYGFVYKTDALNLKHAKIVYEINNDSHEKIEYTLSIMKENNNLEDSKKFLDYLKSDKAKEIFKSYGFSVS
ncbi:MAG: molybdate ABC transporter substrate-binding protein [Clostridium sp.]